MRRSKPSIKEVAALARVSTATVSNVFSGRKPVNDDLRKRVLAAAERLGYRVDPVASQLRSGRARIVAILVPDLTDTFFATIVSRLETMASDEAFDVIVASSHDDPAVEASRLGALLSWRPAGLILVPCSDVLPDALAEAGDALPTVLVDRVVVAGASADTVTIDNVEAGELAARHLLDAGHDDIVIGVSSLGYAPIRERAEGAARLIAAERGRRPDMVELGSDIVAGAQIFSRRIARNGAPGAVIALTNVTTLSVLSALAEHRIPIPGGTSVVAFDDYPWMAARNTGLTAIRQPADEIAATAWNRLRLRMAGEPGTPVEPTVLRAELVVRDSVKTLSPAAETGRRRPPPGETAPGRVPAPAGDGSARSE